jgi:hypothetical protein
MNRVDAWRMIQRRATELGTRARIGCHTFRTQFAGREPAMVFRDLAEMPESYQIDGRLLGTGVANFSASGLKRQDNDLIVIESAEAASAFRPAFDARFASGEAVPIATNR